MMVVAIFVLFCDVMSRIFVTFRVSGSCENSEGKVSLAGNLDYDSVQETIWHLWSVHHTYIAE